VGNACLIPEAGSPSRVRPPGRLGRALGYNRGPLRESGPVTINDDQGMDFGVRCGAHCPKNPEYVA